MKIIRKFVDKLKICNYYDALSRLIGSFFFASIITLFVYEESYNSKEFAINNSIILPIILLASFFIIFSLLRLKIHTNIVDSYLLFFSALLFSIVCLHKYHNFYLAIGFSLLMIFVIIYLFKDDKLKIKEIVIGKKATIIIISCFAFCYILFGCLVFVFKSLTLYNSTFDIGIFGQMFSFMKSDFIPYTTIERDYLLSHFSVHFSPIVYLLLPFYAIFPSIITLDILQTLFIASGIFPLYLICKNHNFSNKLIILVSFIFFFYPAMTGGCLYNFHENMFLVPLLLWLIYLFEKDSKLVFIPLVLTLMIKEDAFVYTTVISLYFIVNKASYKKGSLALLISIVYFIVLASLMERFGLGIMDNSRFGNYMTNDSLLSVFTTLFKDPGYLFSEVFMQSKFDFMLKMFLPVLFVPFFSKNLRQLILLIPLLLVNLMPAYVYQYDITFQYVFGSSVCIIYLFILNIENVPEKEICLPIIPITCLLLFFGTMMGQKVYLEMYKNNAKNYNLVREELSKLDCSKSIVSSDGYIPELIECKELYVLGTDSAKTFEADYVVFDLRFNYDYNTRIYHDDCIARGYEETMYIDGYLIILEK